MKKVIRYFLGQRLMINLFTVLILSAGAYSALNLQREVFPNVNFDILSVRTNWIGASAIDIERLVTNEIEDSIDEVSGIKEYRSQSLENVSIVTVTIDPDEPEPDKVIDSIRSSIDQLDSLPEEADSPILTEVRSDLNPIIEWAIIRSKDENGKSIATYKQLRDTTEILEEKFLALKEVASVTRIGWRDLEIVVDLNPNKMRNYLIGSNNIIETLRNRNVSLPGGDIFIDNKEAVIRTVAEFSDTEEIKNTPIRVNDIGSNIRIGSVAKVYEEFAKPENLVATRNQESLNLTVLKKRSADTIFLSDKTKEIVKQFSKTLPPGIYIEKVFDYSFFVKRRLSLLTNNLYQGAILVFVILVYFLGWRFAIFTALSIPFSFTLIFLVLSFIGSSINLLTLFGLIMVSGMLTDPAIVVSENIVRLREKGMKITDAVVHGASEVFAPIMTTVYTTLATFAPLMLMTGIFGKFVSEIPYVIVIGVVASLFPGFLFMTVNSLKQKANNNIKPKNKLVGFLQKQQDFNESKFFKKMRDQHFRKVMTTLVTYRKTSMLFMILLFGASIPLYIFFGSFKLFPNQVDSLQIHIETPIGSTQEQTYRYLNIIGKYIDQIPKTELDTYIARSGVQTNGGNDPLAKRGDHYGMINVHLYPEADRKLDLLDIVYHLKQETKWLLDPAYASEKQIITNDVESKDIHDPIRQNHPEFAGQLKNLTISRLTGGPPVGQAISIELIGNDFEMAKNMAQEYRELLSSIDGLFDINDSITTGKKEYLVYVDDLKTTQTQLSAVNIAQAVNTSSEGTIATSIRRPNEEVDIRVRYAKEFRSDTVDLNNTFLTNRFGNLISLNKITKIGYGESTPSILHFNGRRLIHIFSDIDDKKISATKAARIIDSKDDDIRANYPDIEVRFAGENEDTAESLESLSVMSIIGLFIIFCLLAILFRSMLQPFIILTSVLFATAGVIYAFLLHGLPLSFLSLIGLIGLAGVVVNDPIVLTDFANQIRNENPELSNKEVVIKAGLTRLRPNFLTSSTTIAGLIPTAYGIGGGDPFLVPTALAFCWGLTLATIMSLFFHPILIYYEFVFRDFRKRIKSKLGFV